MAWYVSLTMKMVRGMDFRLVGLYIKGSLSGETPAIFEN